jgi:RNA polymerase sigma-70 factor (ECF subfamily)
LTNNHADAEDLLQDTLMQAYTGFRSFQQGTNLKAWLFRIMSNRNINVYRRLQRRPVENLADEISDRMLFSNAAHASNGVRSAEAEVMEALPDKDIVAALAALPETLRTTVYYADVEGYPYREIAAIMDIPLGTVMSRLHRARTALRTLLFDVAQDRRASRERSHLRVKRRHQRGSNPNRERDS